MDAKNLSLTDRERDVLAREYNELIREATVTCRLMAPSAKSTPAHRAKVKATLAEVERLLDRKRYFSDPGDDVEDFRLHLRQTASEWLAEARARVGR